LLNCDDCLTNFFIGTITINTPLNKLENSSLKIVNNPFAEYVTSLVIYYDAIRIAFTLKCNFSSLSTTLLTLVSYASISIIYLIYIIDISYLCVSRMVAITTSSLFIYLIYGKLFPVFIHERPFFFMNDIYPNYYR